MDTPPYPKDHCNAPRNIWIQPLPQTCTVFSFAPRKIGKWVYLIPFDVLYLIFSIIVWAGVGLVVAPL